MRRLVEFLNGPDGKLDEISMLSILGVLTYLALASVALWRGQAWDPRAFADGLGKVLLAASFGMGIKAKLGG
jgi:hypothetical protein